MARSPPLDPSDAAPEILAQDDVREVALQRRSGRRIQRAVITVLQDHLPG